MRAIVPVFAQRIRLFRAREALGRCLAYGLGRCPVLTMTAVMVLAGIGMVLSVSAAAAVCALPLGLLLGWL